MEARWRQSSTVSEWQTSGRAARRLVWRLFAHMAIRKGPWKLVKTMKVRCSSRTRPVRIFRRAALQPGERHRRATRSGRHESKKVKELTTTGCAGADGEATLGARRRWKGTGGTEIRSSVGLRRFFRLRALGGATALRRPDHRRLGAERRRSPPSERTWIRAAHRDHRRSRGAALGSMHRFDGRPRLHRHPQPLGLHDPRRTQVREIRQGVTTMVLGESRSAGPIKAGAEEARARADGVTADWTTSAGTSRSSNSSTCRRTSRPSARSRCGLPKGQSTATPPELTR